MLENSTIQSKLGLMDQIYHWVNGNGVKGEEGAGSFSPGPEGLTVLENTLVPLLMVSIYAYAGLQQGTFTA